MSLVLVPEMGLDVLLDALLGMLSPTDYVKDRLVKFYSWDDPQAPYQALLVVAVPGSPMEMVAPRLPVSSLKTSAVCPAVNRTPSSDNRPTEKRSRLY